MKYDPAALPSWEQERGGGPITKLAELQRRCALLAELKSLTEDIKLLAPNAPPGSRLHPRLHEMRERRRQIRAELGQPQLVRAGA